MKPTWRKSVEQTTDNSSDEDNINGAHQNERTLLSFGEDSTLNSSQPYYLAIIYIRKA
jgi:hypothetical protein